MSDGPRAMILAAGLGTRLRPLTDELPKPLVWVGDRPAVAHVAARLSAAGIGVAAINTHHLAGAFSPAVLARMPVELRVVHEPRILGTAGGVANAAPILGDGDVGVWNGDILVELDVAGLLAAHREAGAPATLAVAPRPMGQGTVGLGEGGRVVRLRGERFGAELSGADFVGVQVLGPELRARLPAEGCLVGDGYLPALRRGEPIATYAAPATWDDIGSIEAYLRANRRWLELSGRGSHRGEGVVVAAGIEVTVSVIGAGAVIGGSGAVRGSVIWPGARAEAPLEGVVVTATGRVVGVRQT